MIPDALHDRYDVGSRLGGGTGGEVYAGRDRRTGEPVAIKHFWRPGAGAAALREAAALLGLDHPHVVRCRDFLYLGTGELYLITDYVAGGDLRSWLAARAPLGVPAALAITGQLLDGLGALHDRGLVHGDVKPENILVEDPEPSPAPALGAAPRLRLGDLGSARLRDAAGPTGAASAGTPAYLAPERYLGRLVEASDFYSVGVILYEALVGRRPFEGDPAALRRAHRTQTPDLSPIAAPLVQDFVGRLLAKDPADRFATVAEARRVLRTVIGGWNRPTARVSRQSSGQTRVPWRAGPGWRRAVWQLPDRRERGFLLRAGDRPQLALEVQGVLEVWDALAGRPTGLALPQVGWAIQVAGPETLVYATPGRVVRWNLAEAREETLLTATPRLQTVRAATTGSALLWVDTDRLHWRTEAGAVHNWPCRHFGWSVVARFRGADRIGFTGGPYRPVWIEAAATGEILAQEDLPGPMVDATDGEGDLLATVAGQEGGVATWRRAAGRGWRAEPVVSAEPWIAGAAAARAIWSLRRGGVLVREPVNGTPSEWRVSPDATGLWVSPDESFVAVIEGEPPASRVVLFAPELPAQS